MCYKSAQGAEEEAHVAEVAKKEGLNIKHFDAEELKRQFSDANYNVKGAFYYDCDAHMTPDNFMKQICKFLDSKGVKILNTEVRDFEVSGNQIIAVKTSEKMLKVDEVIIAAGTWTSAMAKKLKLTIPIEAGKGYSFDLKRETGIVLPSILTEAKVAVTPMNGFTRFAGTMELGGINDIINPMRVEAIAHAAEDHFEGLKISSDEKESARSGLRPCSPDGIPYIGRPQKWKNLNIGAGHAMMGWSLGPATGKLISEVVNNKKSSLNMEPFSPDRKF